MKVGLVLSGGIAKGAYQIGVLKAITDNLGRSFFNCISASSVGALSAFSFLTNQLDTFTDAFMTLPFKNGRGFIKYYTGKNNMSRLLDVFSYQTAIPSDFYITNLCSPKLSINYNNLKGLQNEALRMRIESSVVLPVFCSPIDIDGIKHYDGAVVDNIPTFPLLEKNEDLVIACYFDRTDVFFENEDFNSKVYRLNFMDSGLLKDSFTFEESNLREMISVGYETALKMIDELELKKDDARLSQDKVREKYSNLKCSEKHITGDIIVRGLNKIGAKLARKRTINDITEG